MLIHTHQATDLALHTIIHMLILSECIDLDILFYAYRVWDLSTLQRERMRNAIADFKNSQPELSLNEIAAQNWLPYGTLYSELRRRGLKRRLVFTDFDAFVQRALDLCDEGCLDKRLLEAETGAPKSYVQGGCFVEILTSVSKVQA